jgi:hypothetical protein
MSQPSDDDLRAKIRAVPETAKIATSIGIPLEEYIDMVLHFTKNPTAEPVLDVMDDEEAASKGMPSAADLERTLGQMLDGTISLEEEHERSHYAGFDDAERTNSGVTGSRSKPLHEPAPPLPTAKKS